MHETPTVSDDRPSAVRLGYWRYAKHWAYLWAAPWAALAAFQLRGPYAGSRLELAAALACAVVVLVCSLSFLMWAGTRLACRYGGRLGRSAASLHLYGQKASDEV